MERESVITCPRCGFEQRELMPEDSCTFFYECGGCRALLRPREGDCCVFCSFGTSPCPPIQRQRESARRPGGGASASTSARLVPDQALKSALAPTAREASGCAERDLVSSRSWRWLWGLPLLLIALGLLWSPMRAPLWTVAFLWAGLACVVNAARCGRVHCYVTGPLYLGLAGVSALNGLGLLSWEWRSVGVLFVMGTALAYAPEFVGKQYVRRSGGSRRAR